MVFSTDWLLDVGLLDGGLVYVLAVMGSPCHDERVRIAVLELARDLCWTRGAKVNLQPTSEIVLYLILKARTSVAVNLHPERRGHVNGVEDGQDSTPIPEDLLEPQIVDEDGFSKVHIGNGLVEGKAIGKEGNEDIDNGPRRRWFVEEDLQVLSVSLRLRTRESTHLVAKVDNLAVDIFIRKDPVEDLGHGLCGKDATLVSYPEVTLTYQERRTLLLACRRKTFSTVSAR